MSNIQVSGIDEAIAAFDNLKNGYEREVSEFLRGEGKELNRRVKKAAGRLIKKRTGNYLKGVKVQKPYKYYKSLGGKAKDSVKVYGKRPPAYHTHLIEEGHEKVLWGRRTAERVKGFYIYAASAEEMDSVFENDTDKFIEKILSRF